MLAIIGGTGLTQFDGLEIIEQQSIATPYGETSSPIIQAKINQTDVVFLSRHGFAHAIPPHKVNYRANIWALKHLGISDIIAVNAVGGMSELASPGMIVFPDQIIDYSYGREHTFFADDLEQVTHIDFSYPYSQKLVKRLITICQENNISYQAKGTYACTQGPRLETAAEIQRLLRDGCDIVGMTGMPEAALARELELNYASISVVANWGAGLSETEITMADIEAVLAQAMDKVKLIIRQLAL